MATKKTTNKEVPAVKDELQLAVIVTTSENESNVPLPDFLKGDDAFEKKAPDGFTPLIQFGPDADSWNPGTWLIAKYIGARADIGPNQSWMYDFSVTSDGGKTFAVASLWGSTILDNKMRMLDPKPDDWVFIQYLGTVETSRKASPAKDFRLAVVSTEVIKKAGYGSKV